MIHAFCQQIQKNPNRKKKGKPLHSEIESLPQLLEVIEKRDGFPGVRWVRSRFPLSPVACKSDTGTDQKAKPWQFLNIA